MGRTKQIANKADPNYLKNKKLATSEGKIKMTVGQIEKDKRMALIRARQSKRAVVFRNAAKAAGYLSTYGVQSDGAAGRDAEFCLLSIHDAKRLIKFNVLSDRASENDERAVVLKEALPPKALNHAQVRLNALFGTIMNDAVLRVIENNHKKVTAKDMFAAIRPYVHKGRFSQARKAASIVTQKLQESGKLRVYQYKSGAPAAAKKKAAVQDMDTSSASQPKAEEEDY